MNKIFVDTSAWIALLNAEDDLHEAAVKIYQETAQAITKITSNMVISETYTLLLRRVGHKEATDFLKSINAMQEAGILDIVWSNKDLEQLAFRFLQKYNDHDLSFVDAVSFAMMKELQLTHAFAFDKHFIITGFSVLEY